MQFILLLPLIVVLSVAGGREVGPSQLDGPEAEQLQQLEDNESEEERISDDRNSAIERAGSGRPSLLCTAFGGECIRRGANCEGIYDPRGCRGSRFACCAPEPAPKVECPVCPAGFFGLGTDECFKYFNSDSAAWSNWTEGKAICASEGLYLAEPSDEVAAKLGEYMKDTYDPPGAYAWLGATADSSKWTWDRQQTQLAVDNPAWMDENGELLGTGKCLAISALKSTWNHWPGEPYISRKCSISGSTLCQMP